jgi:putative flippase GtrA
MIALIQELLRYRFVRFLAIGLINTLVGYGCFALLLCLGLHYAIALLIATIFGVLFNFKSIGVGVFQSHDNYLIFRFVAVYGVIYSINVLGIKTLLLLKLGPYVSGAILILPMAILAFILNRRFVFDHEKEIN